MTTIRYFVPEDGDSEAHPNVFLCAKSRHQGAPPTLGQIKSAFPLPGRYHFRFKSPLVPGGDREKGGMAVWMDCVNDTQSASVWKQTIIAKVTRISMEDEEDEEEEDEEFMARHRPAAQVLPPGAAAPQSSHAPPSTATRVAVPPPAHEPLLDVFDGPTSAPVSVAHSGLSSTQSSTGNLLDVPAHPVSAPASGGSLLDMDAHAHPAYGSGSGDGSSHGSSGAHNDFLGMTTAPPATPAAHHAPRQQPHATPQQQQQPPNGYAQQQQQQMHRSAAPTAQQQNQQQRAPTNGNNNNAFESFTSTQGPFGGLDWK